MSKHIGYARVSTSEQNLNLQLDALNKYNCVKIFSDHISGTKQKRPELDNLFEYIRPGDILVVWRLDRLARSLRHLIDLTHQLEEKNIQLISVTEKIDTTSSTGRFIFHMFASLAEFERNLIRDRVMAGLSSARARGRKGGRPRTITDEMIKTAQELWNSRAVSVAKICESVGMSKRSFYKVVDVSSEKKKKVDEKI